MTLQIATVIGIAVVSMGLFITETLRMDVVALLVLAGLALTGIVSPENAFSGFSNPATITVAAMFILAAGLRKTGALSGIGRLLEKSRSPTAFLVTLFAILAVIAPFVNNTAVVAVFMPIVIAASLRIGLPPTKTLIPLSYVSQMTGVVTLIGTSTNLIVNSVARDLGFRGFTMFEFLPLGLACLAAGWLYLLTVGRWLLPEEGTTEFSARQESGFYVMELHVTEDSAVGDEEEPVAISQLSADHRVYVLELWRGGERLWSPRAETLKQGDVLLVRGRRENLLELQDALNLRFGAEGRAERDENDDDDAEEQIMAEVMIAPNSVAIGHRLATLGRGLTSQVRVLGIQRRGEIIREQLQDTVLRLGDILLLVMPEAALTPMRRSRNFIILSELSVPLARSWRAPFTLAVMALVVALPALGILPIALSATLGGLLMVLVGALPVDDVYEAIDWRIIFLMAGLLPLGLAMNDTGAAQFIVDNTVGLLLELGPHVVLAALYLMALLLGELMSNSAAAVLLTPIGMSTAALLGADPTPFLIAITFSASTSFLTPVGYQTNTMVYSAGGYRFMDFVKVGLPLNLIFWVIGVVLIPVFWPF